VDAPREEWILVAEVPSLVSQEQFDRVQAKLASNRRFAQRNNKAHPYLLRGLVSCGVCGLACLARANLNRYRYYSCTGRCWKMAPGRRARSRRCSAWVRQRCDGH
jgi:site-specific DNA recombinase